MNPQPNPPQLLPRRSLWAYGGRGLIVLLLTLGVGLWAGCSGSTRRGPETWGLSWGELPSLPAPRSGQMAGVSQGILVSIGGTDFPVPLFAGGRKVWYEEIFALRPGRSNWERVGGLDHPLAYGGSLTTAEGIITLGGSDAERHYATVSRWRIRKEGDALRMERTDLPPLPIPLAMAGAARLGMRVYVAGGLSSPDARSAEQRFWSLDLTRLEAGWTELEPWPGPARILPVLLAQGDALYLISGAELIETAEGAPVRAYLRDGYRFRATEGWRRIADLPRPAVAAPAVSVGQSHLFIFGGDDGVLAPRVRQLGDRHPGFSQEALAYHTITDTWVKVGRIPQGLVTTVAVPWEGRFVIPGGEDRPGHRRATVLAATLPPRQGVFGWLDYLVLTLYLLPNLFLGLYLARRNRTTRDFFLGGRRIPWWAAGLSLYSTQLSAITYLAIPAKAYAEDWTYLLAQFSILAITPIVIGCYLPFFRRLEVTTAYEYLEKRFNPAVRIVGSSAFILLQTGRMVIVLFLPAMALSTVSGLNVYLSILLMGGLCTLYTMKGGIEAVIWTDVLQAVVLLGGAFLAWGLLVQGVDGGVAEILSTGGKDGKMTIFHWSWDHTTATVWVVVVGNLLSILIPYTTDQAVIQRYLTTRDEAQARRAIWINAWMTVPTSLLFFGLGLSLYVFFKRHPGLLDPALPTDATFAWYIARELPKGAAGLVVAGVFAAAMSTLSSSINSLATTVVTDFHQRWRPAATDASRLRLAQGLTLLFGVLGTGAALLMATFEIRSLWDLFLRILGLLGGGLAGIFALGIFTQRAHARGALVGILASTLLVWWVQQMTATHFFLYGAIGIVTAFGVGYGASLVLPGRIPPLDGLTIRTLVSSTAPHQTQ
jgi:SSS family solute:Na+ symporter